MKEIGLLQKSAKIPKEILSISLSYTNNKWTINLQNQIFKHYKQIKIAILISKIFKMNNLKNSKRQEFKTWKKLMNCKSKKYWH